MTITGIVLNLMYCSGSGFDHRTEAAIPLSGEDLVITEIKRQEYETEVRKYKLSPETVAEFTALIDKYGITGWTGKTPTAPKTYGNAGSMTSCVLTLNFDDGSNSLITFREVSEQTGKEAVFAFRKLYSDTAVSENLISEETVYPKLKECREIEEEHGPVTAIETGSFTMGMMYGSNETYTQLVEKIEGKEGTVRVTIKRQRGNAPEQTSSKEIRSDIFSKVQEISDKENLPCWHYASKDPSVPVDTSMKPMDYSASGWLNLYYDDTLINGFPKVKRTIGETACSQGGKEVDRALTALVNECVEASGLKTVPADPLIQANPVTADPNAMPPLALGMMAGIMAGMQIPNETKEPPADNGGPWDCSCGAKGVTGKFCSECGNPRP